jgi:hypothetical protein
MIGTVLVISRRTFLLAFLIAARSVAASGDRALPLYQPRPVALPATVSYLDPDGAVVVVGYNDMRDILAPLAARFTATHPSIRIALELPGTRFAPAALASGKSALAPMGAESSPRHNWPTIAPRSEPIRSPFASRMPPSRRGR